MLHHTIFIIFVFYYTIVVSAFATHTGTVKDLYGNPIEGASVTFTDIVYTQNRDINTTNRDGRYEISMDPVFITNEPAQQFILYQNFPNPFNPSTTIKYSIDTSSHVNISIYNVLGQLTRTLVDGYFFSGVHTTFWDGFNDNGETVAAGVYIYMIRSGDKVQSKKMLLFDGGRVPVFQQASLHDRYYAKRTDNINPFNCKITVSKDGYYVYCREMIDICSFTNFDITLTPKKAQSLREISFVQIPAGTFQMGDEIGDLHSDCRPVHAVTLNEFEMSSCEITNAQYAQFLNKLNTWGAIGVTERYVYAKMGRWEGEAYLVFDEAGYYGTPNKCWIKYVNGTFTVENGKKNLPVVFVTWFGAKAYAISYGYDLPTEAEWEYACRGGKNYQYGTHDGTISILNSNYNENIGYPIDVGTYAPTPYGLYDMSGNVFEFCHGRTGNYTNESVTNPLGPDEPVCCSAIRGGCYGPYPLNCRSACRRGHSDDIADHKLGFRVVRRPGGLIHEYEKHL